MKVIDLVGGALRILRSLRTLRWKDVGRGISSSRFERVGLRDAAVVRDTIGRVLAFLVHFEDDPAAPVRLFRPRGGLAS